MDARFKNLKWEQIAKLIFIKKEFLEQPFEDAMNARTLRESVKDVVLQPFNTLNSSIYYCSYFLDISI